MRAMKIRLTHLKNAYFDRPRIGYCDLRIISALAKFFERGTALSSTNEE